MSQLKNFIDQAKAGSSKQEPKRNWYQDRYQRVLVQRNILALVTLVALVVVLLSTISVARLTPLKSVQPFLIQVDEKTGMTQVVNPLKAKEMTANEALKQHFVTSYIRARETYDAASFAYNFDMVRVMSTPQIFGQYRRIYDPNNKESLVSQYGSEYKRFADFKAITFLDENTAQVRITAVDENRGQRVTKNYIVLLSFDFIKLELTLRDRYLNPLGFQVNNYRLDEEFMGR